MVVDSYPFFTHFKTLLPLCSMAHEPLNTILFEKWSTDITEERNTALEDQCLQNMNKPFRATRFEVLIDVFPTQTLLWGNGILAA